MTTKICTKCKKEKEIKEFCKNSQAKDNLSCYCKNCMSERIKIWRDNNKDKIKIYRDNNKEKQKQYRKKYCDKNKEKANNRSKNWYKNQSSWEKTLRGIVGRCKYKSNSSYKYYGEKGIKCLITKEDLKTLWFRDKAYELIKPSIDRKNPDGDYTFKNCRFIEMFDNLSRKRRGK